MMMRVKIRAMRAEIPYERETILLSAGPTVVDPPSSSWKSSGRPWRPHSCAEILRPSSMDNSLRSTVAQDCMPAERGGSSAHSTPRGQLERIRSEHQMAENATRLRVRAGAATALWKSEKVMARGRTVVQNGKVRTSGCMIELRLHQLGCRLLCLPAPAMGSPLQFEQWRPNWNNKFTNLRN